GGRRPAGAPGARPGPAAAPLAAPVAAAALVGERRLVAAHHRRGGARQAGGGAADRGRAAAGVAGGEGRRLDQLGGPARPRKAAASRSARAITARWVFADGTRAITEASITHTPSVPRSRPPASTTASGSSGRPIRQEP